MMIKYMLALGLLTSPVMAMDYPTTMTEEESIHMVTVVIACSFTLEDPNSGLINDDSFKAMAKCVRDNYYRDFYSE